MPKIGTRNITRPASQTKPRDFAPVFEKFGVTFGTPDSTGNAPAEICLFCGGTKFSVNIGTGQYRCFHGDCQATGNTTTFLTWVHKTALDKTTTDQYRQLKENRGGIAIQTLKRHELAFHAGLGCWLIPFKSAAGNVVNIQLYYPDKPKPNKFNLPGLPLAIYGIDRLSADTDKIVYLCEGVFDAIALNFMIGSNNRPKYDILATPGAFQERWADFFKGRKVIALYDNDAGGESHREGVRKFLGESRVAESLKFLNWPKGFDGCDINDLIGRLPEGQGIAGWIEKHCVKVVAQPALAIRHGRSPKRTQPIEWVWPDHIRTGTYVSFAGKRGTMKSTIAMYIVVQYTLGLPMPLQKEAGMPAGHVLYVHAEDDAPEVDRLFEFMGGDFDKWHAMPGVLKNGDDLDILKKLAEMEEVIKMYDIRLVILDGQNSMIGGADYSSDGKARANISNRLHHFAQRLNICLIGIRNEADAKGSNRAMGPQSLADIARCTLSAEKTENTGDGQYFVLKFERISNTAPENYLPIPYHIENHATEDERFLRKVVWEAR